MITVKGGNYTQADYEMLSLILQHGIELTRSDRYKALHYDLIRSVQYLSDTIYEKRETAKANGENPTKVFIEAFDDFYHQ